MKAAFDAGFDLENEGVHYHEEITAYRDTAHLRYDGELQGDVLYTFIKSSKKSTIQSLPAHDDWLAKYIQSVDTSLGFKEQAIELHLAVIRNAATSIGLGRNFKETEGWLNLLSIIGKANKSGESVISTCEGLLSDK
jgi:hypothetical protein